jgi:RimJ/RimL family protein N-acetyltransferase
MLKTPRLYLRPFKTSDINSIYLGWLNDPEVVRYSNQRFVLHTASSCYAYFASFVDTSNSFFLIEESIDGKPIGTATVYRLLHHGTADIGLMVGERCRWGQGYGREAWEAILEAVLNEPGLRKVTGGTVRPNRAMISIMEKSGMKRESVRFGQELIDGIPVDILCYAKFAL